MQIFQPWQWFILLLQKGVYPYEYMDVWEEFNETSLPQKKKKKKKRGRYKSEEQEVSWAKKTYSVSDIQDYFEYILEKHGEKTDNPSITM